MLRRRLDPERHGSDGFTTIPRVIAVVAVVGFLAVATHMTLRTWYDGRIMPGVMAAGHNLGGMTLPQARAVLQKEAAAYRLKLTVAGQQYALRSQQLGVEFDPEATLMTAYNTGRTSWIPPLQTESVPMAYSLDSKTLAAFTASVAAEVGIQPVDAGVVYKNGKFETLPDKDGMTIDKLGLKRLIERDLSFPTGNDLALNPRSLRADIAVGTLGPTVEEAKRLIATPVVLTYGDKVFAPSERDMGRWLTFEKRSGQDKAQLVPVIDSSELKDYIQSIADKVNVPAVNKLVNIENGVSKVTQEGADGLAIDQDAIVKAVTDAVMNQKSLTMAIPTKVVAFKAVSTTLVTLDYPKYIEVNLRKQRLWVWQDQKIIYESPITSGAAGAGFGTVTGLFSIYYKTTNTRLRGQGYDVPVKYWMPFYLGYGLHDAVWRNGRFGGQDYYYGGSHGCVNMPDATAEFIYNWASVGTPVWVHN